MLPNHGLAAWAFPIALLLGVFAPPAHALPSYARQTSTTTPAPTRGSSSSVQARTQRRSTPAIRTNARRAMRPSPPATQTI